MLNQAMEAAPKVLTHFGAVTTAAGGGWLWLGTNYHQVGIVGMMVGIGISIASYRANKESNRKIQATNLRHKQLMEKYRRKELGIKDED